MPVTLDARALVGLADLKRHLQIDPDEHGEDDLLKDIINDDLAQIENFLKRKLIDPPQVQDFHSPRSRETALQLRDFPVREIVSVHECVDGTRTYNASTLLVAGTDFIIDTERGWLHRVEPLGGQRNWAAGFESIKVTWRYGWAAAADIDEAIIGAARRHCIIGYREWQRQKQNILSSSDESGQITRWSPVMLTKDIKQALMPFRKFDFGDPVRRVVG